MTELTEAEVASLDGAIREWEDHGGPIINHLLPAATHIKAAARAEVARDMRTKIEAMADDHSLWAQHRPVVGKFAGMFAAVGCSCMDRVFVAGAESYAQHIAALLADGGEPQ